VPYGPQGAFGPTTVSQAGAGCWGVHPKLGSNPCGYDHSQRVTTPLVDSYFAFSRMTNKTPGRGLPAHTRITQLTMVGLALLILRAVFRLWTRANSLTSRFRLICAVPIDLRRSLAAAQDAMLAAGVTPAQRGASSTGAMFKDVHASRPAKRQHRQRRRSPECPMDAAGDHSLHLSGPHQMPITTGPATSNTR